MSNKQTNIVRLINELLKREDYNSPFIIYALTGYLKSSHRGNRGYYTHLNEKIVRYTPIRLNIRTLSRDVDPRAYLPKQMLIVEVEGHNTSSMLVGQKNFKKYCRRIYGGMRNLEELVKMYENNNC